MKYPISDKLVVGAMVYNGYTKKRYFIHSIVKARGECKLFYLDKNEHKHWTTDSFETKHVWRIV